MFDHQMPGGVPVIGARQPKPTKEQLELQRKVKRAQSLLGLTTQIYIECIAGGNWDETTLDNLNLFAYNAAKKHIDFIQKLEDELNAELKKEFNNVKNPDR